MHTFLGVPILVRGGAWGNLYLTEKAGGEEFSEATRRRSSSSPTGPRSRSRTPGSTRTCASAATSSSGPSAALEATSEITRAVGGELDLDRDPRADRQARARARGGAGDADRAASTATSCASSRRPARSRPRCASTRTPVEGSLGGEALRTRRAQRVQPRIDGPARAVGEGARRAGGARRAAAVPRSRARRDRRVRPTRRRARGSARRTSGSCWRSRRARPRRSQRRSTSSPRRTRRSMEASERERGRWARELHDETLQEMGALKVLLAAARRSEDCRGLARGARPGRRAGLRSDRATPGTDHRSASGGAGPARRAARARGARRARRATVRTGRLARARPRLRGRASRDAAHARASRRRSIGWSRRR